jgi:hypothetical protein
MPSCCSGSSWHQWMHRDWGRHKFKVQLIGSPGPAEEDHHRVWEAWHLSIKKFNASKYNADMLTRTSVAGITLRFIRGVGPPSLAAGQRQPPQRKQKIFAPPKYKNKSMVLKLKIKHLFGPTSSCSAAVFECWIEAQMVSVRWPFVKFLRNGIVWFHIALTRRFEVREWLPWAQKIFQLHFKICSSLIVMRGDDSNFTNHFCCYF